MPGMHGLGSSTKSGVRMRPVIVITGFPTEATAIDAANLGVFSYLTKPFKAAKVLEAAARALGICSLINTLRLHHGEGCREWHPAIRGLVDLAHPALADQGSDVVVPEAGADGQRHLSVA